MPLTLPAMTESTESMSLKSAYVQKTFTKCEKKLGPLYKEAVDH